MNAWFTVDIDGINLIDRSCYQSIGRHDSKEIPEKALLLRQSSKYTIIRIRTHRTYLSDPGGWKCYISFKFSKHDVDRTLWNKLVVLLNKPSQICKSHLLLLCAVRIQIYFFVPGFLYFPNPPIAVLNSINWLNWKRIGKGFWKEGRHRVCWRPNATAAAAEQ